MCGVCVSICLWRYGGKKTYGHKNSKWRQKVHIEPKSPWTSTYQNCFSPTYLYSSTFSIFLIRIRIAKKIIDTNINAKKRFPLTTVTFFPDHWHYIFIIVTLFITTFVICGTYLDVRLNNSGTLDHYKEEITKQLNNRQEYLLCFSIVRNWYRLTGQPKTELGRDLRCLNAFRYIT